tara:strand:- start:42 stop:875 length:834 start_codon:yes stop_codon:yes gene_type:complete
MKSSSAKKQMNQAMALGSRPITRRTIPGLGIGGFDGWFTGTTGVTTVSNAVSEWKNLVPGGVDLLQSTANLRPALTTINGLTALAPDGASGRGAATDVLTDGDLLDDIGTGDFYIGIVMSIDAFGTGPNIIQKGGTWTLFIGDSANKRLQLTKSGPGAIITTDNDSFADTDETFFVEVVRTGTDLIVYKNGTNIKQVTDSTDLDAAGTLSFGRVDCKVGEFICRKGTVKDKQRQIIEALMARKWNIGFAPTQSQIRSRSGIGILPAGNRFRNKIPRY